MMLQVVTKGSGFLGSLVFYMLNKVLYMMALDKDLASLRGKPDHTLDEMDVIAKEMLIADLKDSNRFADYCRQKGLSLRDCMTLLAWIFSQKEFLNDIKASGKVTYADACHYYERAQTNTIVIHRVNYIMHQAMIDVYDILERDRRLRQNIKKAVNNTERLWGKYYDRRKAMIERSAMFTLQDHLRLACDAVRPYLERVYEAIRDNMIQKGHRDVEVKARCVVALLMGKVVIHSFRRFFVDFERESGVDYSKCFECDDISAMVKNFSVLCDFLGLKTRQDDNGCYDAVEYNPESCLRFKVAWKDFIAALRDDDLMDESAQKAINLNPEVKKEYDHIISEAEKENMIENLSQKYKVS